MVIEDQIIGDLQSLDSVELLDDNTRKARAISQGMQTNLIIINKDNTNVLVAATLLSSPAFILKK